MLPPLLWGVAFANLIHGVPLSTVEGGGWMYDGTLLTLLNPYSLLGGIVVLLLCFNHGLVYLALKAVGGVQERAQALANKVGLVTIVAAASFIVWTIVEHLNNDNLVLIIGFAALAAVSLIGSWLLNMKPVSYTHLTLPTNREV